MIFLFSAVILLAELNYFANSASIGSRQRRDSIVEQLGGMPLTLGLGSSPTTGISETAVLGDGSGDSFKFLANLNKKALKVYNFFK